jgi:hypothetical protein
MPRGTTWNAKAGQRETLFLYFIYLSLSRYLSLSNLSLSLFLSLYLDLYLYLHLHLHLYTFPAELHDKDLQEHLDKHHTQINIVGKDALEDVQLVVDLSTVDLVEQLTPHKRVEDDRKVMVGALLDREDDISNVHDDEQHNDLVDGLTDNVFDHAVRDEALLKHVDGLAGEKRLCGTISRKSKSSLSKGPLGEREREREGERESGREKEREGGREGAREKRD